jgi:hypothetical protein
LIFAPFYSDGCVTVAIVQKHFQNIVFVLSQNVRINAQIVFAPLSMWEVDSAASRFFNTIVKIFFFLVN